MTTETIVEQLENAMHRDEEERIRQQQMKLAANLVSKPSHQHQLGTLLPALFAHEVYGEITKTMTMGQLVEAVLASHNPSEAKPKNTKKVRKKKDKAPAPATTAAPKKGRSSTIDHEAAHKAILEALEEAGKPLGNGELVAQTDFSANQVRGFCTALVEEGKIVAEGQGRGRKYQLA